MIKRPQPDAYSLVCDECGTLLENYDGDKSFPTTDALESTAAEMDWELSGTHGESMDATCTALQAPMHFCSRRCLCKHFGWIPPEHEPHKVKCSNCGKMLQSDRKVELRGKMATLGWYGGAYKGSGLRIGSVYNRNVQDFFFCSIQCAKDFQHNHNI